MRDLRVRWALEEAGLPYRVVGVPFQPRTDAHLAHQPFGQVPWLQEGNHTVFESGAILMHLGVRSDKLLPADAQRRSEAVQWVFAAINSVEMASWPWVLMKVVADPEQSPISRKLIETLTQRLQQMEPILARREWLAGTFSVADVLMADVLRTAGRYGALADHAACLAYVQRATARPAFQKALADQLSHFANNDASHHPG